MGDPTSSILSQIYLQHVEHTATYEVLIRNNILGYFRYVDNILIAYNSITDIEEFLSSFNNLIPTMKFTMENEIDNTINFLDITIRKESRTFPLIYIENPPRRTLLYQVILVTYQNISMPPYDTWSIE